nr:MAG TPA: hypothetical protein [Caudoviricetes sp.]
MAIPENRATIVSAYRSQVCDLRASTAALRLFSGKPLNSFTLLAYNRIQVKIYEKLEILYRKPMLL